MTRFLLILVVLALCFAGCMALPEQPTAPATETLTETATVPTTAHVHSYAESTVEATCTEKGYTQYTCDCGDSYRDKETAALGHTETQEVIPATEEAPGCTRHTCTRCGETREDRYTWLAATPTDFFDDAAFIGDSITLGLRNYNMDRNQLGTATILCQGSYSVAHAVNDTMYLSYQGEDMTPQDALKACEKSLYPAGYERYCPVRCRQIPGKLGCFRREHPQCESGYCHLYPVRDAHLYRRADWWSE